MDGERVVSFWRDLASIVDTSGTCTILFIPYSIEYRGRGCEFLSSWWMIRITRICCFYCCRGCCNDDIRRYLFLTERFEIRFEVNQLIEQKLTRGGKKKRRRKSLSFRSNASFPFVASFTRASACFGFRKRNRRKGGNASVPQGAL